MKYAYHPNIYSTASIWRTVLVTKGVLPVHSNNEVNQQNEQTKKDYCPFKYNNKLNIKKWCLGDSALLIP